MSSSLDGIDKIGIVIFGASAASTIAGWHDAAELKGVPSWDTRLTIWRQLVKSQDTHKKSYLASPAETEDTPMLDIWILLL